jgi:hypothetical protein
METPVELSDITDGDGCSRAGTESGWTTYLLSSMHDDGDSDGKSSLASDASTGNIQTDKMMHYHYDDNDDSDDVGNAKISANYLKGKVEKTEKNTEKKWFTGLFKKDASSSKGGSKNKKTNFKKCGI